MPRVVHFIPAGMTYSVPNGNPLQPRVEQNGVVKQYNAESWADLESQLVADGIVTPSGPSGTFVDKAILKGIEDCLKKAGAPEKWQSLHRWAIVNGKSLSPITGDPPKGWYENGEMFTTMGNYIAWIGLTVDGGRHLPNHKVKLYYDGTVKGEVNCFANGWMDVSASYLKRYIEEWSERIESKPKPYWDEIDWKSVPK
jgi:hypothetical protein